MSIKAGQVSDGSGNHLHDLRGGELAGRPDGRISHGDVHVGRGDVCCAVLAIGRIWRAHVCNHGIAVAAEGVFVAGADVSSAGGVVVEGGVVAVGDGGADAKHFAVEECVEVAAYRGLVAGDEIEGGAVVGWRVGGEVEGLEELVGVADGDEDGGGNAGERWDGSVVVDVGVVVVVAAGVDVGVHVHVIDDTDALASHDAASSAAVIAVATAVVGNVAFAYYDDAAAALFGVSITAAITIIWGLLVFDLASDG